MFKKTILLKLSFAMFVSMGLSMQAAWQDYAKPAIVGSLSGATAGTLYACASGLDGGSIVTGAICSGIPLFIVSVFKAGVDQTQDARMQEDQKKNVLVTNAVVGTTIAGIGALAKWSFGALMACGAPNGNPFSMLGSLVSGEAGQFLIGNALAAYVAYRFW